MFWGVIILTILRSLNELSGGGVGNRVRTCHVVEAERSVVNVWLIFACAWAVYFACRMDLCLS
mgnify:CR=1 FL=1